MVNISCIFEFSQLSSFIALSKNMKICEKELSNVGGGSAQDTPGQLSLWNIGGGDLWSRVRKGTRDLAPKFSDVGEKAREMVLLK